jgi:hypothetical protein
MTTLSIDLDALLIKVQDSLDRLDEVDDVVKRAAEDDATLAEISSQVAASINPEWMRLSPLLMERANWSAVNQTVEQMEHLVQTMYRTALRPRQEHVHNQYKRWLKQWSKGRSPSIQKFLDTADDRQLEDVIELLNGLETVKIADSVLQRQVRGQLKDQVNTINRLDKQVNLLIEELTTIRDTLLEAAKLDEVLSITKAAAEVIPEPISRDLAVRWLTQQRRSFDQSDVKIDRQGLATLHDQITSGWQQLQPILEVVKHMLQHLLPDELKLAKSETRAIFPSPQKIADYVTLLGKVLERRQQFASYKQLTDEGIPIAVPMLVPELETLRATRSELPHPSDATNLQNYLDHLDEAHHAYEEWSDDFARRATQLISLRTRWSELIARHGLPVMVVHATDDNEPADMDGLITDHNDLVERTLYDQVLDRMGRGEEAIDPVDLLASDADLTPLLRLAGRRLINLRITS